MPRSLLRPSIAPLFLSALVAPVGAGCTPLPPLVPGESDRCVEDADCGWISTGGCGSCDFVPVGRGYLQARLADSEARCGHLPVAGCPAPAPIRCGAGRCVECTVLPPACEGSPPAIRVHGDRAHAFEEDDAPMEAEGGPPVADVAVQGLESADGFQIRLVRGAWGEGACGCRVGQTRLSGARLVAAHQVVTSRVRSVVFVLERDGRHHTRLLSAPVDGDGALVDEALVSDAPPVLSDPDEDERVVLRVGERAYRLTPTGLVPEDPDPGTPPSPGEPTEGEPEAPALPEHPMAQAPEAERLAWAMANLDGLAEALERSRSEARLADHPGWARRRRVYVSNLSVGTRELRCEPVAVRADDAGRLVGEVPAERGGRGRYTLHLGEQAILTGPSSGEPSTGVLSVGELVSTSLALWDVTSDVLRYGALPVTLGVGCGVRATLTRRCLDGTVESCPPTCVLPILEHAGTSEGAASVRRARTSETRVGGAGPMECATPMRCEPDPLAALRATVAGRRSVRYVPGVTVFRTRSACQRDRAATDRQGANVPE